MLDVALITTPMKLAALDMVLVASSSLSTSHTSSGEQAGLGMLAVHVLCRRAASTIFSSLALYYCACSLEVTVTSLYPPRLHAHKLCL